MDIKNTGELRKIFKNILIIVVWLITALVSSSIFVVFLTRVILGDFYTASLFTQSLSFAIASAGFIAIYAKFQISKISAFLLLSVPSLILCTISILIYPSLTLGPLIGGLGSIYPFIAWASLQYQKKDPFSFLWEKFGPYIRSLFRKKRTRIFIAAYLSWLLLLFATNNFEFSDIGNFRYYDEVKIKVLALAPLILAPIGIILYKWCKRGE
jgi:hypothetical protein